jgi:hypothetical protein
MRQRYCWLHLTAQAVGVEQERKQKKRVHKLTISENTER